MSDGDEQAGALVALICIIAFFYWVTGPENDQVVEYEAACTDSSGFVVPIFAADDLSLSLEKLREARSSCRVSAIRATTYRVDAERGRVVQNWAPDLGLMNQYENCVVFDLETWSCPFSDASGRIGMVNGLMAKSQYEWKDESARRYFSQRRWQYWVTSAVNLVGIYPTIGILKPAQSVVPN